MHAHLYTDKISFLIKYTESKSHGGNKPSPEPAGSLSGRATLSFGGGWAGATGATGQRFSIWAAVFRGIFW